MIKLLLITSTQIQGMIPIGIFNKESKKIYFINNIDNRYVKLSFLKIKF